MALYASFDRPNKEKQAIGNDLSEVKELVLTPSQTLDLKEKLEFCLYCQ
jgi:predicted component of type VI protein secretion system